MSITASRNERSISSYSKAEWESILAESAYRGFKINRIAKCFKKGEECSFRDHLIKMISKTGTTTIVNMSNVLDKRNRWSFSRLFHNIRMLFPDSAYAKKFKDRISKLAEKLTMDGCSQDFYSRCQANLGDFAALPTDIHDRIIYAMPTRESKDIFKCAEKLTMDGRSQDFYSRCQANLGDFAALPTDIHDRIIYAMPTRESKDIFKCIDQMKMFWKAPLGSETIFGTIDVKKFATWVNEKFSSVLRLAFLEDEDLEKLFPYIHSLYLSDNEFNFDLIGRCKMLKSLRITQSRNIVNDHFQEIFNLPNLNRLSVSCCYNITDAAVKWIKDSSQLTELNLYGVEFTGEGLKSIKKLKNLTYLGISNCGLNENEALKHLSKLPRLKFLNLEANKLTKEGLKHFQNIPSLLSLSLKSRTLIDEDLELIAKIKTLSVLMLQSPKMTGAGFKYLTESNSLIDLDLRECTSITDDNLQYITQIKKLNYLIVKGCPKLKKDNFDKLSICKTWEYEYGEVRLRHHFR